LEDYFQPITAQCHTAERGPVRNVRQLLIIAEDLEPHRVALRILDFNGGVVDTNTPTGKLMLQLFGAFAEFERSVMLERQRIGIDAAKGDKSKYPGRQPSAMRQRDKVRELDDQGMSRANIAAILGISERSVYRALAA
jgi:DNA invertase Pin-like site-specific DNA recombinase